MSAPPLTNWDVVPLGRMRDADIAERLGCPTNTVVVARLHRGIAAPGRIGRVCLADWPCETRRSFHEDSTARLKFSPGKFAGWGLYQGVVGVGVTHCPWCGGRLA